MTLRRTIALLLLGCMPLSGHAAGGDGVTATIFIGALAGYTAVGAAAYEGLLARELPEWRDDATETTAALIHQCGVSAELRLVGLHNFNMLLFSLKNESTTSVELHSDDIEMAFSNGRSRLPNFDSSPGIVEIKSGWRVFGGAPFPNKLDFKDADWIDVKIPMRAATDCTMSVRLKRNPARPPNAETYTERTALEIILGGGLPLWRAGAMSQLGTPSFSFEAAMEGYWSLHSGLFMRFMLEGFSGGNATTLAPYTSGLTGSPYLRSYALSAGYTHRWALGDRWFIFAGAGLGLYTYLYDMRDTSGNVGRGEADTLFFQARASIAFRFLKVTRGVWRGNYAIDLAVFDHALPFASTGGSIPSTGNSLGATLGLRMGG